MSPVDRGVMSLSPAGAVLLAAGRGSRLADLTAHTHKSLLPVAGQPALRRTIDALLKRGVEDIVVVTGDKCDAVEKFVRDSYAERITLVFNGRYEADTNILSTELGVAALRVPTRGYLIVETDLVIEPAGWEAVLDIGDPEQSFWVTRGLYSRHRTGGALKANSDGRVVGLVYAPAFDPRFEGWQKLIGLLYVGSKQVAVDREVRRHGIHESIAQYYMAPWVRHLADLPCRARSLGDLFAESFNDVEAYEKTDRQFAELLGHRTSP